MMFIFTIFQCCLGVVALASLIGWVANIDTAKNTYFNISRERCQHEAGICLIVSVLLVLVLGLTILAEVIYHA